MLAKDLVYAARSLSKRPGFALTAVLTIALGIGATTAIFSVVNAVLLRPLPYVEPDRLVLVWGDLRNRNVRDFPFAPGDFNDLREQGTLFSAFAGVVTGRQTLTGDEAQPEQIQTAAATANIFSVLGLPIQLGRGFVDDDAMPQPPPPQAQNAGQPGTGAAPPVQAAPPPRLPAIAVLSHGFWQRRYGGERSVIGKSIDLGGGRAQIVGVLAPGAELLFPPKANIERVPDMWTALRINFDSASRINVFLRVIGRLKPGVRLEAAQSQIDRLSADLRQRFPIKQTAGLYLRLEPMQKNLVAAVKPAILALMGAVVFVLLIACANVANLLLVRASLRERELALRSALGGSRGRLVGEMLAESLVLASVGGAGGLFLAWLGIQLLVKLGPESLPRLNSVTIDPWILAFTAGASLLAAMLFGIVPALRASRPDAMEVLRPSSRSHGFRTGKWLRNGVVMTEVALSFILLIGSGLMFRSFLAVARIDPGFDPQGLLTFNIQNARLRTDEAQIAFVQQMTDRLKGLPGVLSVTAAAPLPLDGQESNVRWGTQEALANPTAYHQGQAFFVQPGYFETMRTKLIAGRTLTAADIQPPAARPAPGAAPGAAAPPPPPPTPVVVDEWLPAKAYPGQPPLGKLLWIRTGGPEPDRYEIVGVVQHERHTTLTGEEREALFFPAPIASGRWVVRTAGDPNLLVQPVRAAVAAIDPLLPVAEMKPMSDYMDRAIAPTRFALVLIGIFGGIAAVLAVVGLYGVLSSSVRQRTSEIGVRVALGASRGTILKLVVGQGLRLSGAGIGLGLVGAFALTRVMSSMLVGVKATDPITFAAMSVFFFGIACLACWIPARRAARLDPIVALREE